MNVRKVIKVPKNLSFLRLDYYVAWFEGMWERGEGKIGKICKH